MPRLTVIIEIGYINSDCEEAISETYGYSSSCFLCLLQFTLRVIHAFEPLHIRCKILHIFTYFFFEDNDHRYIARDMLNTQHIKTRKGPKPCQTGTEIYDTM